MEERDGDKVTTSSTSSSSEAAGAGAGAIVEGRSDVFAFRRQLNRFTTPEELFGPLSVRELQSDNYLRLTDRYLPSATIAFLDEAFKASSAILNSLLTILNERTFCENGSCSVPETVPLLMCIFSSNEMPHASDTSVQALFDRILIRVPMRPLEGDQLKEMLSMWNRIENDEEEEEEEEKLKSSFLVTREDILRVKEYSMTYVDVPDSVLTLLRRLRIYLRTSLEPPISISDRRLMQIVQLLRVCACLNGRRFVNRVDCLLLEYMAWDHEVRHMTQIRRFLQNELLAINSSVDAASEPKPKPNASLTGGGGVNVDPTQIDIDTQKVYSKRCDKIFRDLCEYYDGNLFMKGDNMSSRYTAYRRGKLKQMGLRNQQSQRLSRNLASLREELEQRVLSLSEFVQWDGMETTKRHQFLSELTMNQLACEVEPKLMKTWRFHCNMLSELYTVEECLKNDENVSAECVAKLFRGRLELFSKLWRTAL